jgi:thioesterase domain-containing protein
MLLLDLQAYLHAHIPLSKSMEVAVDSVSDTTVVLRAPLAPNINHRDTAFGGSVSALAILAAWSLLHTRTRAAGLTSRLVIQRNSIEYECPIAGEFTARAQLDEQAWTRFSEMLARKGKARIVVGSQIEYEGQIAARFTGDFVALDVER